MCIHLLQTSGIYGSVYVALPVFIFYLSTLILEKKSTLILEKIDFELGKIDFKLGKIDFNFVQV